MEAALLSVLVLAVQNNRQLDRGFRKATWEYARRNVQLVAPPTRTVTILQLKNKYDNLRKDWKIYSDLIEHPGISVNHRGIVTGDRDVLNAYFAKHPKARKFSVRPLRHAQELRIILEEVASTVEGTAKVTVPIERQPADEDSSAYPTRSSPSPFESISQRSPSTSPSQYDEEDTRNHLYSDQALRKLAQNLDALVKCLTQDHQASAIKTVCSDFKTLPPRLTIALIKVFENEFEAKKYMVWSKNKSATRKWWAKRKLLMQRDKFKDVDFNGLDFDAVMDSFEWSGDGPLAKKVAMQS